MELFLKYFIALLSIMNPLSIMPVFIYITKDFGNLDKVKFAFFGSFGAFVICSLSIFSGESVINIFGVSINPFKIAGGIVIFQLAFSLMKDEKKEINIKTNKSNIFEQAMFPLATPLLCGPGSISTSIVFSKFAQTHQELIILYVVAFSVTLVNFIILSLSSVIYKTLPRAIIQIITKLMGLILASIGVEMIISGIVNSFNLS